MQKREVIHIDGLFNKTVGYISDPSLLSQELFSLIIHTFGIDIIS